MNETGSKRPISVLETQVAHAAPGAVVRNTAAACSGISFDSVYLHTNAFTLPDVTAKL